MIETVADVIVAEWEGGARDDAICELLNRSGIHPPGRPPAPTVPTAGEEAPADDGLEAPVVDDVEVRADERLDL